LRIDRYLHCIRLIKSRSQAQTLIDEGHVRIDGKRVLKSAEEVRAGQVIALPLRGAIRILRITALPARRGPPAEARCHYEELGEAAGD
jgi:ribosome-associated heat shock protein Hsp15